MKEINMEQCEQCGQESVTVENVPSEYEVRYKCQNPDCDYETVDGYEDLYGVMSVPWGFA